jgi:hypothetical protein
MKLLSKLVVPGALGAIFLSACGQGEATTGSGANSVGATVGVGGSGGEEPAGAGGATTTGTGGSGGDGATTSSSGSASTGTAGSGGSGFGTVFTILLENHDYKEIVGSANAPYINKLIAKYGLATSYKDSGMHPSLPNYLYLITGAKQYPGTIDVLPTLFGVFPKDADNLGNQLELAGIEWRSYQESMGAACGLANDGDYAPKHTPFLYFKGIQLDAALCSKRDVDYSHFAADLAAGTYQYMWITPNLLSDGHNPTTDPVKGLKQSDAWLGKEVPKILASDAYQKDGVLFITWDEAAGRNGNSKDQVPMIVISPRLKSAGMKVGTALTHASYLATVEDIFGLPRLGAAQDATSLVEFFNP